MDERGGKERWKEWERHTGERMKENWKVDGENRKMTKENKGRKVGQKETKRKGREQETK